MLINAINPSTNNNCYLRKTSFKGEKLNTLKKTATLGSTLGLGGAIAKAVEVLKNKAKTKAKETYENSKNEILADAPQDTKDSVQKTEDLTATMYLGIKQLLKSV